MHRYELPDYQRKMMPIWTEQSRQKALRREEGKKLLAEHRISFVEQRNKMLVVYDEERTIYFAPATGTYRYQGDTECRKCSGTAEFIKIHFPEATRPQDLKKALDEKVRRMAKGLARLRARSR